MLENIPVGFEDPAYKLGYAINSKIAVELENGFVVAYYKERSITLGREDDFVFWTLQQSTDIVDHLEEHDLLNIYAQECLDAWNRNLEKAISQTKDLYDSYKSIAPMLDDPLKDDAMATIAKLNKMYIMLRYQKRDAA